VITAVVYDEEGTRRWTIDTPGDLRAAREAAGTTWVRVTDADPTEFDRVAGAFDIHDLSLEDVRTDARAKAEAFEGYTFLLLKDAGLRRGDQPFAEELDTTPLGVFLGEDWLVTLSPATIDAVSRVWDRVDGADERVLHRGPDYALSRVLDRLVEDYFAILDALEDDITVVEESVTEATDIDTLEGINALRRDLLAFRKLAWPAREAVNTVARGDSPFVREDNEKYFRDVADQLVQVVDLLETYRDLVNGTRDIYLNALSQSTNEVMKTLTVVATIFIPLTFVAGVYGMNFADAEGAFLNMPELGWTFGYPAVMLGMALVGAIMLAHFRRQGWL